MEEAGIYSNDILIVDRSQEPKEGDIVIAVLQGEFTVKRWIRIKGRWFLKPENGRYAPKEILPESDFEIWGVVTHAIHVLRQSKCMP